MNSKLKFSIALMAILYSQPAFADENATSPWSFEASVVTDVMSNVKGGIKTGTAIINNSGVSIGFDGSKVGINGLRGTFGGFYNNGGSISGKYVGDMQGVSNIETSKDGFYLSENWLAMNWGEMVDDEGELMVKAGILDVNARFDAPGVSALFLNSSHGIIPTFAQTGYNGPSIFPILGLGAIGQARFGDSKIRIGSIDAVPGDINNPTKLNVNFNKNEGALNVAEWEYTPENMRFILGGFRYTNRVDNLLGTAKARNAGMYGQVELNTEGKYSFFARAGTANDKLNTIDKYIGFGVVANGLLQGDKGDQLGLAINQAYISDAGKTLIANPKDNESNVELTYALPLTNGVTVQGDIQHIMNPSADGDIKDATVLGLRLSYEFAK